MTSKTTEMTKTKKHTTKRLVIASPAAVAAVLTSSPATTLPVALVQEVGRLADEDRQYGEFQKDVQRCMNIVRGDVTGSLDIPIFTTSATGLFDAFLEGLQPERRQHYQCHACRRFIDGFGGLVTIDPETGLLQPLLWDVESTPPFFKGAVKSIARLIREARVTGVWRSLDATWGWPETISRSKQPGTFHHLHVTSDLHDAKHPLLTAEQVMAEKLQDYATLQRGLAEFPRETLQQAVQLLSSENLAQSEKCLGVAKALLRLHEQRASLKGPARDNATWRFAATAPPGWCHVKTTLIGSLLEDIQAGMSFDNIKLRHAAKVDPLTYQRAQVAPSAGNLVQAEKIVEKLASAGSLARRFAKLEEVLPHAVWVPRAPKEMAKAPKSGGVFGHLQPKNADTSPDVAVAQPPTIVTWVKFATQVLPAAETIEYLTPHSLAPFSALVTAVDPMSPPILQWDTEERRNPFGWYLYVNGSPSSTWNLMPGTWVPVQAIVPQPSMWSSAAGPGSSANAFAHQGEAMFFLLEGARDTMHQKGGGFFTSTLKNEYHAIRPSLEAYQMNAAIAGRDEATACGLKLHHPDNNERFTHVFRVTVKGVKQQYQIDRWD